MPNAPQTPNTSFSLHWEVEGTRREFLLDEGCSIGRLIENDIVLEGMGVSRIHAKIDCSTGQPVLIDCQSRHGTRVNGTPITQHTLQHGDRIQIQKFELYFNATGEEIDFFPRQAVKFTNTQSGTSGASFKIAADEQKLFQASTLEDLKKANENLRRVQSVAASMVEVMESHLLMDKILDILCNIFAPDQAAILILNESSGNLIPANTFPAHTGEGITVSRTIIDEVQDKMVAILSKDVHNDTRFSGSVSIVNIGIGSTMCAPLIAKGVFLGVIYLVSFGKNKNFSESGLELLMGIANQAAVAIENNRLQEQITEELALRNQLKRYMSGPLVDGLLRGEITLEPGGNRREISCMFSDVKGFTSMSESLDPEQVVELLNEYFDLMVDAIFEHGGTLDKYAGDGLMAVWGNLIAVENHAESAVNAGKLMLNHLQTINARRRAENKPEFNIRIGINSGEAVCGNIGSSRRLEYTVIGDTVNVASRLETQAPENSILISQRTYNLLSPETQATARRHGDLLLKGKERPIPTFVVTP